MSFVSITDVLQPLEGQYVLDVSISDVKGGAQVKRALCDYFDEVARLLDEEFHHMERSVVIESTSRHKTDTEYHFEATGSVGHGTDYAIVVCVSGLRSGEEFEHLEGMALN